MHIAHGIPYIIAYLVQCTMHMVYHTLLHTLYNAHGILYIISDLKKNNS